MPSAGAGHFWTLPQQLWPHLVSPVRAYDGDAPATGPPTSGLWQSNQVVLAALNATAPGNGTLPRGWRCTRAGRPGEWEVL